jgi:MYXO-CTERM domain-containing protein
MINYVHNSLKISYVSINKNMKQKLVSVICVSFACAISASAATINVNRGIGNPGVTVSNFAGTALSAGGFYVAVGTYTTVPTVTNYATLLSSVDALIQFGASGLSSSSGTTAGVLQLTTGITSNGGATPEAWNSQEIYVIVGNGNSRASSTDFAILRTATPTLFPANVTQSVSATFAIPTGAALNPVAGAGSVSGNVLTLQGVPEPSAALLGALGALGLLRRRRN